MRRTCSLKDTAGSSPAAAQSLCSQGGCCGLLGPNKESLRLEGLAKPIDLALHRVPDVEVELRPGDLLRDLGFPKRETGTLVMARGTARSGGGCWDHDQ